MRAIAGVVVLLALGFALGRLPWVLGLLVILACLWLVFRLLMLLPLLGIAALAGWLVFLCCRRNGRPSISSR